jgi:hypothetical protein
MQDSTDQIIKKLKVIAELTPGKTISTSNPEEWCILDHKSWSSSLWRTYAGEGRESGIYEISKLFKVVISILSVNNTVTLLDFLGKALLGFDTLKETYKDDYNAVASVTLISNKTNDSYKWFLEEHKVTMFAIANRNTKFWDIPDSKLSNLILDENSEKEVSQPFSVDPLSPKNCSLGTHGCETTGPSEAIGTNTLYTIEPCGKKNSLDYLQSTILNGNSDTLVKNTDRSIYHAENNENLTLHSKESSSRDSNEHVVLENKPYYEIKKKSACEHTSGFSTPNMSFRTWLHKE